MASKESTESESPSSKRPKLENNEQINENSVHSKIKDLSDFHVEKILNNNTKTKLVCLQGSFNTREGTGLVILEKTAFQEENLKQDSDYFTKESSLKKIFHNDIYGNYEFFPKVDLNTLKTTIIHPATDKHIKKYSIQNCYIVEETPEIYKSIVLPHITEEQFDLQWAYNILDHKSEVDRIVYEDPDPVNGFILLPDLKWNNESIETLYLLVVTHSRDIKSLRDLTDKHLPLLKNIKEKTIKTIKEKFGLNGSQLRMYFHYQPTFYHLHVHISNLRHEAPGILVERAHLLSEVINNIELVADYYQKATLPFVVRENDKLFKKLVENGILTASSKN